MAAMRTRDFDKKIEFSNDGALSLFFLGTGNAFAKKLYNNNLLVIKGENHVLVDIGSLCPLSFANFNTSLEEIENILVTHAHADHAGGLEELALSGMYIFNKKINLIAEDRLKKSLWKNTLKGGIGLCGEENSRQKMKFEDYFTQIKPKRIRNTPRPFMNTDVGNLNLKIFRTKHEFTEKNTWKTGMYSVGILIDERILFTGDTKFDKPLLDWILGDYKIEHIFHDCSFTKSAVHASYEELKTLPAETKAKMTLCHYSDNMENFDAKKDGFAGMAKRGIYYEF